MSTYAYDQLVQAFRQAREEIRNNARLHWGVEDDAEQQNGVDKVAYAIADLIGDDDPRFDAEAFIQEVGA